ncbi:MAG: tRNA1(Val) (adenine(37)-N6)-methyltransferase [Lachnospiraceae bacterium]|nr:tRNA1(Val) (adenine(37)-N6)-methyltransferase [Lachnospiraceae bacterium]
MPDCKDIENVWIKEGERIDDLQRDGLFIIQHPGKFCFGIDAVLLSGFCRLHHSYRVVDLGTGTGILPILLSAKTNARHFVGIEIQADMADMASRSVSMNNLSERISIINGDLKEVSSLLGKNCYEAVVCNPPYFKIGGGRRNPSKELEIARHEVMCTIEDIVRESQALLKQNGHFFMIYTASRLSEAICLLSKSGLQPKRLRLVHPFDHRDANLFMIEVVKGGRDGMVVEPPLIVYKEPGVYTDEVQDLYRS